MRNAPLPELAHRLSARYLTSGAFAVDATVGNGHDTLFLADNVGGRGHVFGFDIQAAAIAATQTRLEKAHLLDRVSLFRISHADMEDRIPAQARGRIQAIMFNLGYLPGGDKSVITRAPSTLDALNAACRLCSPNGLITVLAYPGHRGGDAEAHQVRQWLERLDDSVFVYQVHHSAVVNASAPILFAINKRR